MSKRLSGIYLEVKFLSRKMSLALLGGILLFRILINIQISGFSLLLNECLTPYPKFSLN